MTTKLLFELLEAKGISGAEGHVREIIRKNIRPYVDEVAEDDYGNLICRKKGRQPRLMIAAHMDEIGLMVKSADEDGLLHVSEVGGSEPATILGDHVEVHGRRGTVHGVLTTREISDGHFFSDSSLPMMRDIFVDTGLTKKQLNVKGIMIGSMISFTIKPEIIGNGTCVMGKSIDDRVRSEEH